MIKYLAILLTLINSNISYACIEFANKHAPRDVLAIGQAAYNTYIDLDNSPQIQEFIKNFDVKVGNSTKIRQKDAEYIVDTARLPLKRSAGGGAANTAAGVAALGGKVSFIGAIAMDRAGDNFEDEKRNIGVETHNIVLKNMNEDTSLIFSLISSNGERTILNYPGASYQLKEEDIDWNALSQYKIIFSEGYIWSAPYAPKIINKAFDIAHKNGSLTAFNLGSVEEVRIYNDEFLKLLDKIDILFANLDEIFTLFPNTELNTVIENLEKKVKIGIITMGKDGALILHDKKVIKIPAAKVKHVIDTTGAGDMFAAGFLYGCMYDKSIETSAKLGKEIAGYIIQQIGARPEKTVSFNQD